MNLATLFVFRKIFDLVTPRVRLFLAVTCLASACATVENPHPKDPWQSWNRSVYSFNDKADIYVLKPVAKTYQTYVPDPIRQGIFNFFNNLGDIWVIGNKLMQGEVKQSIHTTSRFIFNSTLGLFGLIDIATPMGLPDVPADFGQTLGIWGVGSGPYVVVPLLGSSTVRDSVGIVAQWNHDPSNKVYPSTDARYGAIALNAINIRANLLKQSDFLDDSLLDKYDFTRDFYLKKREGMLKTEEPFEDDESE